MTQKSRPTLPDEEVELARLAIRFGATFGEMDRVLSAALTFFGVPNWTTRTRIGFTHPRTVYVLQGLLAKAVKTYRAIQATCERGLGQDAGTLLRSLLETSMAIAWVCQKDSDKRAQLMLVHGVHRRIIQLDAMKKTRGLKRHATKAAYSAAARALATITAKLTPAEVGSVRKHWSGLPNGLEGTAAQLKKGWPLTYTLVYRDTSSYAHVSDALAHMFLHNNKVVLRLTPGDWDLERTPKTARLLLWSAIGVVNSTLKLGFDQAVSGVAPPSAHLRRKRSRSH